MDGIVYEACQIQKEELEKNDTLEIEDFTYYKFTIYENDNKNLRIQNIFKQQNYNNLLFYINSNISEDFKLVSENIEYSPKLVYFENNNRISNKLVFMIAFENLKVKNENTIIYNDNIFNNGTIKINI